MHPFLSAERTEKKRIDNSFNPFMNALLLSRGDIEKMLKAFLQQSAKRRDPWEIFYSGDAKFCTRLTHICNAVFFFFNIKEAPLSYISDL